MQFINEHPHRRYNPLTDEWILVSPHRTARPWQGDESEVETTEVPAYDPACYLCPGNRRANGEENPHYRAPFSFVNDYAALYQHSASFALEENELFVAKSEQGVCKVFCYAPEHNLHFVDFSTSRIVDIIDLWHYEYAQLASDEHTGHVQIFENRGAQMGASNPHPHGQMWAEESIPHIAERKQHQQERYYTRYGGVLLFDYVRREQEQAERIIYANAYFVWLVPFWACWPFETMLLPLLPLETFSDFSHEQKEGLADALKVAIATYDALFGTLFPYSMGVHLPPTRAPRLPGWQFHVGFYPPLLRSSRIRKFMVGYELCAMPQRDITPEYAAEGLRSARAPRHA